MKNYIKKKIGIFDSGIGGLSIAHHLQKSNLNADYIYLADTVNMPYGLKSKEEIIYLSSKLVNFLLKKEVDLCIIACHTIATIAQRYLFNICKPIPLIGLIETTTNEALQMSKKRRMGIIGTHATIKTHAHKNRLQLLDNSVQIIEKACLNLASDIERYYQNQTLLFEKTRQEVGGLGFSEIDCLILACTHYALVSPFIQKIVGPHVHLINGIEGTLPIIESLNIERTLNHNSKVDFFVTGDPYLFAKKVAILFNWHVKNVQQIKL